MPTPRRKSVTKRAAIPKQSRDRGNTQSSSTPPNPSHWDGAWPLDILLDFLRLTAEASAMSWPDGGTTLAELARIMVDPTAYAEPLRRVHDHEGYSRLAVHPALTAIEKERTRLAKTNPLWESPYGEARLLHHLANLVGGFVEKFTPRRATLEHQRRTHRATKLLASLLMVGAQPDSTDDAMSLRHLLKQFEAELGRKIDIAERAKARPARADKDAAQRYWLIGFASKLVKSFGVAPPRIVAEAAGMVGYAPDDSTIARYIAAATARAADTTSGR